MVLGGPRLRQAVLVARDLEPAVSALRDHLGLGEPYRDPAVGYFGLVNAVFALGDTFLEVVSPVDTSHPGAATAQRRLDAAGHAQLTGYMAMIQVGDLTAARARAAAAGIREVFAVELEDMLEVHLHPGDMRGAIVSLSEPRPPESWRWGGPDWAARTVEGRVTGLTLAVDHPASVAERWASLAGRAVPGCRFVEGDHGGGPRGIVEVHVERDGIARAIDPARFALD